MQAKTIVRQMAHPSTVVPVFNFSTVSLSDSGAKLLEPYGCGPIPVCGDGHRVLRNAISSSTTSSASRPPVAGAIRGLRPLGA